MEPQKFCQSCTFPISNLEDRGTEKDGSKSDLYCKYCYKDGSFTDPDMTLDRMKEIAQTEMKKQNLPDSGKDVIIKKEARVEIEEDQTKRNYLHLKPNTLGSDLGAGLFYHN